MTLGSIWAFAQSGFQVEEATIDDINVTSGRQTRLDSPLPVGISFWAGPGDEPILLRAASAYEAATTHRMPPPGFGPVRE